MTQPTDADRQRARDVAHAIQRLTPDGVYCTPVGHSRVCDLFANLIAAAIAAARAEGWREGIEEAADFVLCNTYNHSTQPPFHLVVRCTDMHGPSVVNRTLAVAIRNLKEPGHE